MLTQGFYATGPNGTPIYTGAQREAALEATKAWRNDMWRLLTEIEERLCPMDFDSEGNRI